MRFGWICAQGVESYRIFKEQEAIHGYWNDEMTLRAEFITALLKMIGSRAARVSRKRSGV